MPNNVWSGSLDFEVPDGEETIVVIPAPVRGSLRGYTLIQTSGTEEGFEAALYTNDVEPEEIYHLVDLVASAENTTDDDVVAIVESTVLDLPYINRKTTTANPVRALYLKITPLGEGSASLSNKGFTLSITVESVRHT
jgi:hypothetical protein